MRVIGVVDLLSGQAVHARAGRREHYAPVKEVGGSPMEAGNASGLARAYVDRLGLTELYIADLDAIGGYQSQDALIGELATSGVPMWLDGGVTATAPALYALHLGATSVVIGLETLTSYEALREICDAVGGERVAFSLDLRQGEPILSTGTILPGEPPDQIAARAVDAGAKAVIVIDLARVGTAVGMDCSLIARLRQALPDVTLLAGGGVRGLDDLLHLSDSGCDGALVATALHQGRLSASDVAAAQRHCRPTQ